MSSKSKQQNLDSLMDFEDSELRNTMQDFLKQEKESDRNVWNFATISGIAMVFVGMLFLVQMLGLGIGANFSGLIEVMPYVGGVLVTLVGFGFLVGDRKKQKQQPERGATNTENFNFDDHFKDTEGTEDYTINDDLGSRKEAKSKSDSSAFDNFAFSQSKKLYKSRTDKKISGVCGGLARYFGISSTVIRFLFFFALIAGWGAPFLIYIALAIVLDKEPPELMDDFSY
ncbi:phage shock protein C (PspC) family protein [Fodinibius salinus]|uniref:Phage shock protein C (PspC) family protein n=1 Tax=Fodinibius salinus TaxID=860790 RepID=A0A5D3YRB4_9BACT|nr:PspC domain-containing protein [Fodinibius salinus]TYP95091.1 phage shock protein C (PspC) family protein [Fodinibius salinus]